MLGGEESYGLGGYYRSPVESILPVKMRSERKKDEPSIALVLIIDKSGSMNGMKMDLAREAAISALELLGPRDYIGVIAFDGQAYWAVPLQSASNRSMAIGAIESIAAGGGTNMYPGLVEANDALMRTPAAIKHAIALTDGHSQGGDFNGIGDRMRGQNVTVSTVAVEVGAVEAVVAVVSAVSAEAVVSAVDSVIFGVFSPFSFVFSSLSSFSNANFRNGLHPAVPAIRFCNSGASPA